MSKSKPVSILDHLDRDASKDFVRASEVVGDILTTEVDTGAIAKNINEELKKMDLHKVGQAVMLFVAFGVVPALTYGTALGVLEGERTALIGEIQSLNQHAQVISARTLSAAVSNNTATSTSPVSVTTNKDVYQKGEMMIINWTGTFATGTRFSIDLMDHKGLYKIFTIGSTTNASSSRVLWRIPTINQSLSGEMERYGSPYRIKVTNLSTGRSRLTDKIDINPSTINPNIVTHVSQANSIEQRTVSGTNLWRFKQTFKVSAPTHDIYIPKYHRYTPIYQFPDTTFGIDGQDRTTAYAIDYVLSFASNPNLELSYGLLYSDNPRDVVNVGSNFIVRKGNVATFTYEALIIPTVSGLYRIRTDGILLGSKFDDYQYVPLSIPESDTVFLQVR